jgi:RNA polymerase II subunit A small phosphatase-like protein
MAEHLVTQVHQDDDPAKQKAALEEAKRLAEEKKKSPTPSAEKKDDKEEAEERTGCWRLLCCLGRRTRRAPVTPPPAEPTVAPTPAEPPKPVEPEQKWLLGPPREDHKGRKTLVLDLDETLVHSSFRPVPSPDFIISIELEGVIHKVYVQKRPGVDEFLEAVATKFEVIIFTASLDKYANPVLDHLDPKGCCVSRLFRESCVQHYGNYVKDLSLLGRDMKKTLIIDNSPFAYMFQPDNAIPITSWFNDKNDRELFELIPFLNTTIAEADDVSKVIVERKQMVMQQQPVEMMEEEDDEEEGG